MTEALILALAGQRAKELGYPSWRLVHRELVLGPGDERTVQAYNEVWFLQRAGQGIRVSSGYGEYGHPDIGERQHEHGGQMVVANHSGKVARVEFVQTILLRNGHDGQ